MRFTACLSMTAFLVALLADAGVLVAILSAAAPLALAAGARARVQPRAARVRSRR